MRDYPAVIEYVLKRFPSSRLILVGHSVGGHIMALLPPGLRTRIHRAVFVAVNNPNWHYFPASPTFNFRKYWEPVPDMIVSRGYLLAGETRIRVTTPAGVGLEWVLGMIGDDKRYFAGIPALTRLYTSWDVETLAIAFDDDPVLPGKKPFPVDGWCDVHVNAKITRILVTPKKEVEHSGMFKRQSGVWEMMRDLIIDGFIPEGNTRRWNHSKL